MAMQNSGFECITTFWGVTQGQNNRCFAWIDGHGIAVIRVSQIIDADGFRAADLHRLPCTRGMPAEMATAAGTCGYGMGRILTTILPLNTPAVGAGNVGVVHRHIHAFLIWRTGTSASSSSDSKEKSTRSSPPGRSSPQRICHRCIPRSARRVRTPGSAGYR